MDRRALAVLGALVALGIVIALVENGNRKPAGNADAHGDAGSGAFAAIEAADGGDAGKPSRAEFPREVPPYPGIEGFIPHVRDIGGVRRWSHTFETTDDVDKVAAFYKTNMPGFKVTEDAVTSKGRHLQMSNDSLDVTVEIHRATVKTGSYVLVSATGVPLR